MGKYDVWKGFQEAILVIDFVPTNNVEERKKDNTDGATGAMKRQSWWCRQTKKFDFI